MLIGLWRCCAEKLAAPSTQTSSTSIPYASRAEIKTENIQPEPSKGKIAYWFASFFNIRRYGRNMSITRVFYFTDSSFAIGKVHLRISSLPTTGTILYFREVFAVSVGQIASHVIRVPEIQIARDLRGETGQGPAKRASISALAIIIFTRACFRVQWLEKKKERARTCVRWPNSYNLQSCHNVAPTRFRPRFAILMLDVETEKCPILADIELNRLWIWNLRIPSHTNSLRDVISFKDT